MKKDTHPDYVETAVTCTCGASFTTRSTATSGKIHADVCSQCHPFYTGKQKILDTGGRVARFEARYAKKAAAAQPRRPTASSPRQAPVARSSRVAGALSSVRPPAPVQRGGAADVRGRRGHARRSTPSSSGASRSPRRTPTSAWPSSSTSATPS